MLFENRQCVSVPRLVFGVVGVIVLLVSVVASPAQPTHAAVRATTVKVSKNETRGTFLQLALGKKWTKKKVVVELGTINKKTKRMSYKRIAIVITDKSGKAMVCSSLKLPAKSTLRVRSGNRTISTRSITRTTQLSGCSYAPPVADAPVVPSAPAQTPSSSPATTIAPSTPTTTLPPSPVAMTPTQLRLSAATDTGSSSSDGVTNASSLDIEGQTTALASVQIYVNSVQTGSGCTANGSGQFVCAISSISEGQHSITARSSIGSSASSLSNSLSITVDRTRPTVQFTSPRQAIGATASTTITATLSEESDDFSIQDIRVICTMPDACYVSQFSGSQGNYTFTWGTINNQANGGHIQVLAGVFTDIAGNPNALYNGIPILYDMYGPLFTVEVVNGTQLRFHFDEEPFDFVLADLSVAQYSDTVHGPQFQGYLTSQLSNLVSISQDNKIWQADMSSNLRNHYNDVDWPYLYFVHLTGSISDEYGNVSTENNNQSEQMISVR